MVQLLDAMKNDKLYLNPALNRDKLAAYTGINAKTISARLTTTILKRQRRTSIKV